MRRPKPLNTPFFPNPRDSRFFPYINLSIGVAGGSLALKHNINLSLILKKRGSAIPLYTSLPLTFAVPNCKSENFLLGRTNVLPDSQ